MDEMTQVEFEGRQYLWDGQSWSDAHTYMEPPLAILEKLNAAYRPAVASAPPPRRARAPRRASWSTAEPAAAAGRKLAPPPPPEPVEKITAFEGEHSFLASDHPASVMLDGQQHPSVAAALDAAKQLHDRLRPGMQREWDLEKRVPLMRRLLRSKFAHLELRQALLATHSKHLSDESHGADPFWGAPGGSGENILGRLLMDLRAQFHKHYCLLTDDEIVEHLREYAPENPIVPDEALMRDCCWKRISELAELYKDELRPSLHTTLEQRRQTLANAGITPA